MKSRVYPTCRTQYRVGNWPEYEHALVQRGNVTLWISADATDGWRPSPSGQPGGQRQCSDQAIETALPLRLVFRLPLRQAEGFLRSMLSLLGVALEAPDHTPHALGGVSAWRSGALASRPTSPAISASTVRDSRWWMRVNGLR
jgi:hypothetical protein